MGVKVKEKVKGSGEWWIFIDHKGKRKARKIGRDKRVAMQAARKIEAKLTLGEMDLETQKPPTLKEYVDGWRDDTGEQRPGWYNKVAVLSLKNSTYSSYRQIIDYHLLPVFGSKPINEITSRMISDFVSQKVKAGIRSATARNIKHCLSAIMRHAVNPDELLQSNPARGVPIPKPEDEQQAKEQDPFTWADRDKIEKTFMESFPGYHPLVFLGFRTGLRIGEIIGLQWQDVDFFQKLILVQRNITRGKTTTPKSRSGRRYVRMTSQLAEVLRRHKIYMAERTLKQGWKSMPEWVFTNEDGKPVNYGNFLFRTWNKAMEKSGMHRRSPHDMRHTYATLRLSKGDSLAEVSKEMGHYSPEITYKTYYKWLPKESRSDIDELDAQPRATQAQPVSVNK
jgi:integrase